MKGIRKDVDRMRWRKWLLNFLFPTNEEMDEIVLWNQIEKEWRETEDRRNYLKELVWEDAVAPNVIKVMADEKTKKKIHFYEKKDFAHMQQMDVREKLHEINLQEYIEAMWSDKFRQQMCRCHLPGHKDKTSSCKIYPQTNTFYCFWCHRWGTLIDFVKYNNNMDIKDAVAFVKKL